MNRFWEVVVFSRGWDRFYCFPFLILFRLLTPIYQWFSRRHLIKRARNKSRDWKARVVSVGNISVGGTGKTPIVMALAQRYIDAGKRVVVVHSGYGRKSDENILIPAGQAADYTVDAVGDEPMMIAQTLPGTALAIGRDKKEMARLADREFSPDVILIDDGFQRLDIEKDLDIVIMTPFFAGESGSADRKWRRKLLRLFPSGLLREKFDAIGRADAVFFVSAEGAFVSGAEVFVRKYNSRGRIIHWRLSLGDISSNKDLFTIDEISRQKPFVFAGIGSYSRMLDMLRERGLDTAGDYGFGDHFNYDKFDQDMIRDMSNAVGAGCYLTTAKDLVKLADRDWDKPLYCLNLAAEPADPARLDNIIGLKNGQ